jgi:hypothetical protein
MFSHLPRIARDNDIYNYFTIYFQTIFDTGKAVRQKPSKFTDRDFRDYCTNVSEWYCFNTNSTFVPNPETVAALAQVQGDHRNPAPPLRRSTTSSPARLRTIRIVTGETGEAAPGRSPGRSATCTGKLGT